jgi:hypothetical protein
VSTPTVTEIRPVHVAVERDDFADELRSPRRPPYDRAAEREMIRASLNVYLHTHAYDRESTR